MQWDGTLRLLWPWTLAEVKLEPQGSTPEASSLPSSQKTTDLGLHVCSSAHPHPRHKPTLATGAATSAHNLWARASGAGAATL